MENGFVKDNMGYFIKKYILCILKGKFLYLLDY